MGSTKLLELRPDHIHLDSNFNGYKLSLETVPIVKETLDVEVDRVLPSSEQYSFLHTKLFTLHNHLTGEMQGDSGSVYFIDKSWHLQKAYVDHYSNTVTLIEVWEVPKSRERREGDFNFSLKFASDALAVLADGTGMLYVLDTGSRENDDAWQCVFCDEVIGPDKQFVIQDIVHLDNKLQCLLFSIEQHSSTKKHSAVLHWITLVQAEDNSWGAAALRELKSNGDVYYAHLEPSCNAIYCVSDVGFKFTIDSENPIESKPQPEAKKYEWMQTGELVTLKFKLPEGFLENNISTNVQHSEIAIKYEEEVLLSGNLVHGVNQDLTARAVTNGILIVTLSKSEPGLVWSEVVQGDQTGELVPDQRVVEEAHQRLSHLCSDSEVTQMQCEQGSTFSSQPVEECDFEDDKLIVFQRLCCNTHNVTHRANLGSHPVLLTARLSETLAPAMAVRNDVDACLWQPQQVNDDFSLTHEATLLAFAYVQASKQQKKFCACTPDLSYSVICESSRHVFIYKQNKSIGNAELQNRTTGRRFGTVAQQQVVTVSDEEILGLYAANTVLFLLTENSIVALQL